MPKLRKGGGSSGECLLVCLKDKNKVHDDLSSARIVHSRAGSTQITQNFQKEGKIRENGQLGNPLHSRKVINCAFFSAVLGISGVKERVQSPKVKSVYVNLRQIRASLPAVIPSFKRFDFLSGIHS